MARKMTEWPSKRGPITKIMPSDGCIGDTVPLAVGKWYDFHEFRWYMGNVGLSASLAMVDEEPKADVVMGVSTYDIHPVKALTRNGGYWKRMWPEYEGRKSQNYPYLVASNGTLYWARAVAFRAQQKFYVERLKCFEIPSSRAVDIDTPEDLKRARHLMDDLQAKAES